MKRKNDLQQVMEQFLPGYRESHTLSPRQGEVCAHICSCRTEALGGVELHCDRCDYGQPWYHACRDRHCPKCQWRATEAWCDKQCQSVLPAIYYHLVFTLPHELNAWGESRPFVQWTNAARRTTAHGSAGWQQSRDGYLGRAIKRKTDSLIIDSPVVAIKRGFTCHPWRVVSVLTHPRPGRRVRSFAELPLSTGQRVPAHPRWRPG